MDFLGLLADGDEDQEDLHWRCFIVHDKRGLGGVFWTFWQGLRNSLLLSDDVYSAVYASQVSFVLFLSSPVFAYMLLFVTLFIVSMYC